MTVNEMAHAIEAILFVTGEPQEIGAFRQVFEAPELDIRQAVDLLSEQCMRDGRGIVLKRFGNYVQLTTRPEFAPYIEKLLQPVQRQSLSQSALETLSIIAYRQPVTKLEVEAIRGVKCDYSIQSLAAKGLIAEVGRKETVGRPILYGTTDRFLSHFGLETIEELPEPELLHPGDAESEEEPLVP